MCSVLQQAVQRGILLQTDEVVAGGLAQADLLVPGQGMSTRRHQYQLVVAVGEHLQVLRRHMASEDANVGQPLAYRADGFSTDSLLQIDLHLRMQAGECTEVLGQEFDHRRGIGVDAHMALDPLAELAEVGIQLLQVVHHVARVMQ
ncbi:hypothetical protein FQZ97_933740 [compost metagenome]